MRPTVLIDEKQFQLIINRLSHQLIENHRDFSDTVIIGLQPRGIYLAKRIQEKIKEITGVDVPNGNLDVTFFRDDFRRREKPIQANLTEVNFLIEDKHVVLVDDVLYTGRTIRSGLDAMLAYGRPAAVELCVFIDRRFSRQLPVEPNYVGKAIDSIDSQRVTVSWKETSKKDLVELHLQK
ncbi:MAG: bifunctional pyr operon transcriptional regulator/uracil phosphoribosyltransferase PyrR [Flavobacteriales bacterium]|nr:bifunctional pyr operon transcriptional regulator/uracil phosphoribosyltransferase PyrR [Flavobacteriales bacterium]MDG1779891.1 bifunctional pyr operon transcriptional regulator/uracil phosphoribosyltransferase PyrR [Flavobacteriales bacterium]MDG2247011.1 bifunctional pyr operon transcriptional regulator/uracil phosphoribosyltransferase PyrR [Flavobacteriales bacterium]